MRLKLRSQGRIEEISADHVIAATGYKPNVARIPFLDPAIVADIRNYSGMPVLGPAFESTVPGLHFVGMLSAMSYGPVMQFIYGTKHAGPMLARRFAVEKAYRPKRAAVAH